MGNSNSCYQCFSKDYQSFPNDAPKSEPDTIPPSPFITGDLSLPPEEEIRQDPEPISKSNLIDKISSSLKRFLSEIQEEPENLSYKKSPSQGTIQIYTKDIPNGYSMLTIWKCDVEACKVAKFLQLVDKRKDWDVNVSECKKICDITENISVYYTLYKRFLMLAPRDTLIVGQNFETERGFINISTSIDSDIIPENPSVVRAQVGIAGYLIEKIEKDEQGNVTRVTSISEANFGQSLGAGLVKTTSINLAPKFVKSMVDGMKKFDSLLN